MRRLPADPDQRTELARVRAERKPDDRALVRSARRSELEHLADDTRIRSGTSDVQLVGRERRSSAGLRSPDRELGQCARLAPDHDLRRFHREDARKRCCGQGRDVDRVAEAAEMDEEPRQRGEIERPSRPQGLRGRSEGANEGYERLGRLVGQRSLGLDIEDARRQPGRRGAESRARR